MRTHLSFQTRNLDASVTFYRTLLNVEPVKYYRKYALFVTESPCLELALSSNPKLNVSPDAHYGVAVDDIKSVRDAIARLEKAGVPVAVEMEETCCYALQDKVWATDPDGRRWETYYVIAESEDVGSDNMSCCPQSADVAASCCAHA